MTAALPAGLVLLYEDRDLLAVDKPAGLLTMATDRGDTRTAYFLLTDYVRGGQAKSRRRLFIVHRLDRETSGLLVFAKTEEAKRRLQGSWNRAEKHYLALVHGRMERPEGAITSYLAENRAYRVYATRDPRRGKPAHTSYRVLRTFRDRSLLDVLLLTGRKNQIRVHLADLGHPVVGDSKYGRENDRAPRLALHAHTLSFEHPADGRRLHLEAEPPPPFREWLERGIAPRNLNQETRAHEPRGRSPADLEELPERRDPGDREHPRGTPGSPRGRRRQEHPRDRDAHRAKRRRVHR